MNGTVPTAEIGLLNLIKEINNQIKHMIEGKIIIYFDNANGNPGAEDEFANVFIYRKSDNELIQTFRLDQTEDYFVDYSIPECSRAELETRRLNYSRIIYLNPAIYNHPDGYYVVWERCCRNNIINNIVDPSMTGQTFILQFPAICTIESINSFVLAVLFDLKANTFVFKSALSAASANGIAFLIINKRSYLPSGEASGN